jgi:hypothetical protein
MRCQWPGCTREATKITKATDIETGQILVYRECKKHYAPADVFYDEEDITEEEYLTLKLEAAL